MVSTFSSNCKKVYKNISQYIKLFIKTRCFEFHLIRKCMLVWCSKLHWIVWGFFHLVPANQFYVCWNDDHLPAPLTRGLIICFCSAWHHILTFDSQRFISLFLPGGGRNCGVHELICARRGKAMLQPSLYPYLSVPISIRVQFLSVCLLVFHPDDWLL